MRCRMSNLDVDLIKKDLIKEQKAASFTLGNGKEISFSQVSAEELDELLEKSSEELFKTWESYQYSFMFSVSVGDLQYAGLIGQILGSRGWGEKLEAASKNVRKAEEQLNQELYKDPFPDLEPGIETDIADEQKDPFPDLEPGTGLP